MPVMMNSFLLPISPALPFLLEDKLVKGGMQCLETVDEMNTMHVAKRKVGMLVSISEEGGKTYKLAADKKTWQEAKFGGGGESTKYVFDTPMVTVDQPDGSVLVGLGASQRIPQSPGPGFVLTSGANGTLTWMDMFGDANVGIRKKFVQGSPDYISPGDYYDFNMDASGTILLIEVKLNAFDIQLEGFVDPERQDLNPYVFRSSADKLVDDGTMFEDGIYVKKRRYAIMACPTKAKRHYMRMKNIGTLPAKPVVEITYLVLE